ncbi:MAG: ATP synthase F1 subunit delta [Planctomycetes bacterium]|nr:ATP synthase F1 subunit delta [Planctomycetota bacterium]
MTAKHQIKTRIESVMQDPSAGAVARVYADAFLNALPAEGVAEALSEYREFVDHVVAPDPRFGRLFASGMFTRDQKLALVDRVVAGRVSEFFANFLRVLVRHDRLDLLTLILAQAEIERERRTGQTRVQVISAQPLSVGALSSIRERLTQVLSITPIVETAVDPSLLGGLRIRVGDTVYDGSLRARFNQLRHRVRERSLHEIQSGRNRFSHSERD